MVVESCTLFEMKNIDASFANEIDEIIFDTYQILIMYQKNKGPENLKGTVLLFMPHAIYSMSDVGLLYLPFQYLVLR